ncbi:CPBP family glutamic-type intramembrane protease [Spiroplasma platyhelix]|uniref:CAAX prenyl protease 2/Lysostaphin resistance protein A-like domain-containing protein n=1 Tax=Spiroplasma platyhelix PALS-1 TaxID=1276218 RepID=A0A846TW12_9MOLU|nr:CPBP family glutamic-type intramembrane protease [Spiroplasma platyhelix]MBE4703798.1 hypothetical protein [Spiroplasma platyhelix PALS-1]NKE38171.1 hypothetical protein [Spiroplasma platyhelix PALS-1]UJB29056.1 hypothetical protein SPLAT_v1c02920 [Spiroplasma platyhelix PALS-1]
MTESSTKSTKAKKINNEWKKYFTSKEISSDHDYPFNFKNANWYVSIVYLTTFIAIPIIYNLVKNYAYNVVLVDGKLPNPWNNLELLITIALPIIGAGIAFAVDWKAMAKNGAWAAYTHFLFGIISSFFVSLFLIETGAVSGKVDDAIYLAVGFLVQIIIQFIGSLVVIFTNKALRKQIIATFKEAKLDLLIWILVFLALVSILNFAFNAISNSVNTNILADNTGNSKNQNQLVFMATTPLGIFALVLGSIFLAPINEEISYRYGTFSIVRHKWIGFSASLIYFPAMHIMGSGDWNNIFGYLGSGIMAPLLFVCTRGNTTYTLGLHMLLNTIATITLFATMK